MRRGARLIILLLVVTTVVGMGVHYESSFNSHWPYPTNEELGTEYDTHVGETTLLFGTVESVTDDTAQVTVESDVGNYELRIEPFEASVSEEGVVQIFGEIRPDGVILAERVAVVNPASASRLYKYGVSIIGAVLVVVMVFRHWSLNLKARQLETNDG